MAHGIFNPDVFSQLIFNTHLLFQRIAMTKKKAGPKQITQTHTVQIYVPLSEENSFIKNFIIKLKKTELKEFNFTLNRSTERLKRIVRSLLCLELEASL